MTWLKDAFHYLIEDARKSDNPKPHLFDLGRRRQLHYVSGQASEVIRDPPQAMHYARDVASFASLVDRFGQQPVCYVDEDGMLAVLDNNDRGELVKMPFQLSEPYQAVQRLAAGIDQRALVKLLNTTLADAIPHNAFRDLVSSVQWVDAATTKTSRTHLTDTMGSAVDRQANFSGEGGLPMSVPVSVRLFSVPTDVPTMAEYSLGINLDHDNHRIVMAPVGDPLPALIHNGIEKIAETLRMMLDGEHLVVLGDVDFTLPA